MEEKKTLRNIRLLAVFFIIALLLSGITAFPLRWEVSLLCRMLGIDSSASPEIYTGLSHWIASVMQGLNQTGHDYPFLFYGTDWLAFAHIVIALSFIGVLRKPVRNIWVVYWAMIACIAIIPLALICGPIRGIPLYWQLIDCSFGVFGLIPLWLLQKQIRKLESIAGKFEYRY